MKSKKLNRELNKYIKNNGVRFVTSSVSLTPEQQIFIRENNINLSLAVRDLVDSMMRGGK